MGGFRDSFTKDDNTQEEQLGYDDVAFYYFAISVLLTVGVPWTYYFLKGLLFPARDQDGMATTRTKAGSAVRTCKSSTMLNRKSSVPQDARFGTGFMVQAVLLAGLWLFVLYSYVLVGSAAKEISRFDPFEILEVTSSSSASEIKKAYRKLSLVYHPDKNPDDPLAASHFIQITKAYAALTDDVAKANYEKYGNPDGPQTSKVGIGLPRFLLEKDNQLIILCVFFFLLLFVVPMTFINYYQRTKNYAANGVMIETLQFLGVYINDSTRVKNCPELLAASAESRALQTRASDEKAMKAIAAEVVEHKTLQFKNHPVIVRNSYLIWAHMQRLHHLLTPELRADLDTLLISSAKITGAMVEIAVMREWFVTAIAMIEFRRSLVQAIDVKGAQLLQVPHFDNETLKHCGKGKNACTTLTDFMHRDAEQRKGLAEMQPQQIADIEAFCAHASEMEIFTKVLVEDEDEIVVGDVATLIVQMHRKNLRDDEAIGPVHAPLFPEAKYEEWHIFVVEGSPATRILASNKIKDTEKVIEAKLRFQISRPGNYRMELHAVCDSYIGLDKKVDVTFKAFSQDEVKREIIIHREDEDLDLQPTLFQQLMGDLGQEEESEDEEEEEQEKRGGKKQKDAGGGVAKEIIGGADDIGASSGKSDDGKSGQDGDDSSDSSSSASDSD